MNAEKFWKDVLQQNRDTLADWFRPDAVIRWHCTNEQFTVPEFIRANCEYPGEWDGTVERVEKYGDQLVTVVNVYPRDRSAPDETPFHRPGHFRSQLLRGRR